MSNSKLWSKISINLVSILIFWTIFSAILVTLSTWISQHQPVIKIQQHLCSDLMVEEETIIDKIKKTETAHKLTVNTVISVLIFLMMSQCKIKQITVRMSIIMKRRKMNTLEWLSIKLTQYLCWDTVNKNMVQISIFFIIIQVHNLLGGA